MFVNRLAQRLAAAGAIIVLGGAAAPGLASAEADVKLASDPKALHVTVNITDAGFDQPEVTLPTNQSAVEGTITFVNAGTMVHTATQVPGSPTYGYQVNNNTRGYFGGKAGTFTNKFDTGGLAPGERRDLSFTYDGDYVYSSATDCPVFGHSTPGFNCTSAVVHVIDYTGPGTTLNAAYAGETISDPTKRTPHNEGGGSVAKPLSGNVTVTINGTDVNGDFCPGFCPSTVNVVPGTTVTWINKDPVAVHSVRQRGANATNPDTIHPLNCNGIGPGQSCSYTFNYANNAYCTNGGGILNPTAYLATTFTASNGSCGGVVAFSNKYESQTVDDTIFAKTSGLDGGTARKMLGNVKMVVKCSSISTDGRCVA